MRMENILQEKMDKVIDKNIQHDFNLFSFLCTNHTHTRSGTRCCIVCHANEENLVKVKIGEIKVKTFINLNNVNMIFSRRQMR